jgi:hypothetical protein
MKIQQPETAKTAEAKRIQTWIGQHGSNIRNAYKTNEHAMNELEARPGIIERILWRVAREKPNFELTTESMLEALGQKNLMREVKKQLKADDLEASKRSKGFAEMRRRLIASKVPKAESQRDAKIAEIESWFQEVLPEMRDTKEVLGATALRLESGRNIHPVITPLGTTEEQIKAFEKGSPGRVYVDKMGTKLLLLKPGEKASLEDGKLAIGAPAAMEMA